MSGDYFPTAEEILAIHDRIEQEYDMKFTGARVAAPRLKFRRLLREIAGEYAEDEVYLHAAALLQMILTAHYFEDGNKRTAWLTTRRYLDKHGVMPAEGGERAHTVLKKIRRYNVNEVSE